LDPDPGGPKAYGSSSRSATLEKSEIFVQNLGLKSDTTLYPNQASIHKIKKREARGKFILKNHIDPHLG
jgi:hypothetical protein